MKFFNSYKRDYTKFNIRINGNFHKNLNKRQAMILTIGSCVKSGISPTELMNLTGKSRWIWVNAICKTTTEFEAREIKNVRKYAPSRWFNSDNELLLSGNKTYAFSNQHGKGTFEMLNTIFDKYPLLNGKITKN